MFLRWCRDELVLSFIFVKRFPFVDSDALRIPATAYAKTLYLINNAKNLQRSNHSRHQADFSCPVLCKGEYAIRDRPG